MLTKVITYLTILVIAVLAVPVIILLFLIYMLWSAAGRLTAWIDRKKKNKFEMPVLPGGMEKNMKIRNAQMDDLEAISSVEAECFPAAEAASVQDIRARLSVYPNHFWLLFDEQKLVGFVDGMVTDVPDLTDEMYEKAEMHHEDGRWQMIFGVNTIPSYRNRGCAEQMLRQVIEAARKQKREGLVLTCKEKLIHYYAKFGFVNEGISESVHGNVVWYQMRLKF